MKIPILRSSSILAAISILGTGCADMTPLQNAGVFGAAGGAAAGGIARASGASVGESVAIGAATTAPNTRRPSASTGSQKSARSVPTPA